ncbi:MAG: hypothetical protein IKK51_01245 [Oscillospiraceae bacterium]|nr:hypothetical protein [Oscillospiraceae bacterium]
MNIKVKAIALLLASVTSLSFTGCSQILKSSANGYNRSIKVTGGTKLYDSNGIIDGFENGKATGTWIKWNDIQYYNAKTTNAKTTTLLKFTCTATLKQTSVSNKTKTKTLTGIVNYNGNGKSLSRIKLGGIEYK